MIHFAPVPEPQEFKQKAQEPGERWLAQHPDANRPKDYWSPFKSRLADGFGHLCGYSAMYEPVGTVDHFVSFNEAPDLAYRWSNYRYSSGWINSSKSKLSSDQIFDPYEVQDGWFELHLPSLQLKVSPDIPPTEKAKAGFVLQRLHLAHDERILRQRRAWYRLYQEGKLTLEGLREMAPLIARAIEFNFKR
jgi:hypothetical protein